VKVLSLKVNYERKAYQIEEVSKDRKECIKTD
jgi:hypothetical protein